MLRIAVHTRKKLLRDSAVGASPLAISCRWSHRPTKPGTPLASGTHAASTWPTGDRATPPTPFKTSLFKMPAASTSVSLVSGVVIEVGLHPSLCPCHPVRKALQVSSYTAA